VKVGNLVQLLDHDGIVYPNVPVGIVTGFDNKRGRVHVHWSTELRRPGASWPWGRLKVINASR